ncbi:MAG: glutamate--tRNA ligase [Candidatus Cloacimonetes bacterium]|nr:glutamate--tRNA ligase [Candidatus Cloacimonadota bacterium]MBL7149063.1 glutamate--tRNA ligase [Candidatus Cloacimonadota bacterium]
MNNEIRVRFAPSPTGYLHVGSLRTALYNYLYARKTGGKFILRIEDTDRSRYVEGAVENLIETLQAVGLEYDEGPDKGGDFGPYFQSKRTDIYNKYVQELLEKDAAYHCFCTEDDLKKMREEQIAKKMDVRYDGRCRNLSKEQVQENLAQGKPFVIRAKIPDEGEIVFFDIVRERVSIKWETVDDQVLIKSDGYPTYHLANVVDDHLMEITHVIRGEEWLSSVPKHLFLYQALGWKPPKMCHLPLLLNPDKSKLSKRQGDVAVEDFLKKSYLPEALLNFVALLGWHAQGDDELYSLDKLENEFSLKRISKAGAVFDVEKLNWMNGHYLRSLELGYIAIKAKSFFVEAGLDISDNEKYLKIVDVTRNRISTLAEITEVATPFYASLKYSEEDRQIINDENSQKLFSFWLDNLKALDSITEENINHLLKQSTDKLGIKGKDLYFPLRLALFGSVHGPELPVIFDILGKEETIKRFTKILDLK